MSGKPKDEFDKTANYAVLASALDWLADTAPVALPSTIARNSGAPGVSAAAVSAVLSGAASGEVELFTKLPDVPASITGIDAHIHWKLFGLFVTANIDEEGADLVRRVIAEGACPNITPLVCGDIMKIFGEAKVSLGDNVSKVLQFMTASINE